MTFTKCMITGASSGIGQAVALDLAKKLPDTSFLLLGRNRENLIKVVEQIGERGALHICDLATLEGQQEASALIEAHTPDLLINCAGLSYYGLAITHTLKEEGEMVEVNITALQKLTLTAIHCLKKGGKKGTILNISSAAAYLTFPGNATYAASKAFVSRFSEALDLELTGSGIRVLTFAPGQVDTPFSKRASKGKALSITRRGVIPLEKVSNAIWNQIKQGKRTVIYNTWYALAVKLATIFPTSWVGRYIQKRVVTDNA